MDYNNFKINIAALSRKYKVDRKTINKYLNSFEKKKTKNKTSKLDKYYKLIKSLLSSSTQTFSYIRVLRQYLEDNYEINIQYSTFYNYIRNIPEFYEYLKKGSVWVLMPIIPLLDLKLHQEIRCKLIGKNLSLLYYQIQGK